jgi:iron-sulfur cluster assembly protein
MKKVLFSEQETLSATPGPAPSDPIDPDSIRITASAAKEVLRQSVKRNSDPVIRLGIRGGGCTGFSYMFDWVEGLGKDTDHVFSEHGIRVHIDPKSFKLLKGMELDFQRSMMGYGFKFNNPNAKGTCGCGESVQF